MAAGRQGQITEGNCIYSVISSYITLTVTVYQQKWYRTIPESFEEPCKDSKAERSILAPKAEVEPYWEAREVDEA